ncbi:hypothetical protein L218DRAFT_1072028 [Marasmius fiardii PR-910]|nr:hypothetical protein L218DRAFT_1072028 [Marasmius fiardii PR-910]
MIDLRCFKGMYPPLPQIKGDSDIILDINTHKSLRTHQPDPLDAPDYGDTERLCILGENAMQMLVAEYVFSLDPPLSAQDMKEKQQTLLAVENYKDWIKSYKLRLLSAPGTSPLSNDQEVKDFFNTYVGAVYHRNGFEEVSRWVSGLLNPRGPPGDMDNTSHDGSDTSQQPPSYGSQHYSSQQFNPSQSYPSQSYPQQPGPSHSYSQQPPFTQGFPAGPPPPPPPPQPAQPAPPLPTGASPPPLLNGVSSLITLAVVNQVAAQRGMAITYEPNPPVGPAHTPIWTVRCMSTC